MGWVHWVVIGSTVLLTAVSIGAWKRWGIFLNKLGLQARQRGSPHGYNEPELTVAPHNVPARRYPVAEAITDGVTGLQAGGYFMEALEGELRRSNRAGRQFSVIMMGLDRLKQSNDCTDLPEGDKVLMAVATLICARTREPDVVASYGEDEIVSLLPETTVQQAETLAERLRAAVEADDFLHAYGVTASIGIATFPTHGANPKEILRVADCGMYLAKHYGGNCVKVGSLSGAAGMGDRDQ